MTAAHYIDELVARGRHHFTTTDAVDAIGGSDDAVRAQLRRLKRHGRIASPMRSFHVIVPPEYRRLGCVPAELFIDQLMAELGEPYYIALLSAAERHGAAHQRPQSLQVMVGKNRPPIVCGLVRVLFIARANTQQMPTMQVNTPRGYLRVATPEMTALELVGYPQHAGGLNNVVTVLSELVAELREDRLLEAARLSPVGWSQRLGFLLDWLDEPRVADVLVGVVHTRARSYVPLRRALPVTGASRNAKWKVVVNVALEPDS